MEEAVDLLRHLLAKMTEVGITLEEISGKLNNLDGIHSLDDVVDRIEAAVEDIVGGTRYNLTDIHAELTTITTELSNVNTTIMLKD